MKASQTNIMIEIANEFCTDVKLKYDWANLKWVAKAHRTEGDDAQISVHAEGQTAPEALKLLCRLLKERGKE